ncbi:MAG: hypothetical protein MJ119_00865 [Lachnospiraceae bacterium]|nr:hypothetical protein [Lachnospiraceae bacterium]
MRSTNDQLQEILKRADEVKDRRLAKKRLLMSSVATGVFAILLVVVSFYIPSLSVVSGEQDTMTMYGSLVVSVPYMGYVVVGFLSFLLGMSVMLVCFFWKTIQQKENKQ